jgi:HAD superfamily phosphoserine phosphatase-like hydrolase
LKFQTKVVAFDFDGTLTKNLDHRTTWERIWVALGYTIEECSDLHRRFSRKEFSHQKWCELTFEKFRKARLKENLLRRIAHDIKMIDGTRETLEFLKSHGVRLYIVSGSIRHIIRIVLGDLYDLFDEVKANEMRFDSAGNLERIEGTRYDFEGKAQFLRSIISEHSLSELDVLFVGNSLNDIYASRSGARTLCVNPHMTNPDIEEHWTYAIKEMTSLRQILRYVQI